MNTIVTLSFICILIEIFHVSFHNYIRPIIRKVNHMYQQSKKQETAYNAMLELYNAVEEDEVLQEAVFGNTETTSQVLEIINAFVQCMRTPRNARHEYIRIIDISSKEMGVYLAEFVIDFIYWIISIVFVFIVPGFTGIIVFAILVILSKLDSINDKKLAEGKDAVKYYYLVDAFICITMFIIVIMLYR